MTFQLLRYIDLSGEKVYRDMSTLSTFSGGISTWRYIEVHRLTGGISRDISTLSTWRYIEVYRLTGGISRDISTLSTWRYIEVHRLTGGISRYIDLIDLFWRYIERYIDLSVAGGVSTFQLQADDFRSGDLLLPLMISRLELYVDKRVAPHKRNHWCLKYPLQTPVLAP